MGKHRHKNKRKRNIPIFAAAVLLCLMLFSTYFVTGLFARYTTSAENGDSARVAKFSVEGGGIFSEPIVADLVPGESQTASIVIYNNSEVAVEYTVAVTNVTNNLPLSLRMEKDGADPAVQTGDVAFTVQHIPGKHTDQYTLYIDWTEQDGDLDRMGMVDYITVTVTAAQID